MVPVTSPLPPAPPVLPQTIFQLMVLEAVPLLERNNLGAQFTEGSDHVGIEFGDLAKVALAKGVDVPSADHHWLQ